MKKNIKIYLVSILGLLVFSNSSYAAEFDGKWKATASTETGKCKKKFSFNLNINDGDITGFVNGKKKSNDLMGQVDADGNFDIKVVGMESKGFRGLLQGSSGSGSWSTGKCSGSLTLKL